MKRLIIGLLLNGGATVCAVYGLYFHVEPARNVILFLVWVGAALTPLVFMCDDSKRKVRATGRSIPRWVAVTNDIAIMVMLASVGRFFSAAAVLWQMCFETAIYEGDD